VATDVSTGGFLYLDEVATNMSSGGLLPQDEVGTDMSSGGFLSQDDVATDIFIVLKLRIHIVIKCCPMCLHGTVLNEAGREIS
jgi:hypothetical protein